MMAYSYSAVKQYEQCPAQYKFNRIDRLPQPTGDAASRGTMIHTEIENILNGGLVIISDEVQYLLPKIETWIGLKAQSEMKFAVDKDWKAVAYDDPTAWFRGVIDLYIEQDNEATVLDFKTGKDRDYTDQVAVYAAVILATKPHIDAVNVGIEFIDLKKYRSYNTVIRGHLADLQTTLSTRINQLQSDKIYAANPSGLCKFCHYRKDNGGPCKW
jgi:hypothetical protein